MGSTRYPKDDDTEAKIALLMEYRKLAEWVWRETPSLKKQYPDHWVALAPGGELFAAKSMDELLTVLDEKGLRDANVFIEFLNTNPRSVMVCDEIHRILPNNAPTP